jgi:hypothetical protein
MLIAFEHTAPVGVQLRGGEVNTARTDRHMMRLQ